jgi:hypothetical protein
VFTKKSLRIYRKLTGTFIVLRALPNATATDKMEEMMTRLVILSFALALLALPAQAQQGPPGSVNINGNIFDPPPAQGYAAAPTAMPRAAAQRHVRTHRMHSAR